MNAEGSVITSEDSAITSEGSAIKNANSVKERENSEGKTCLADWGEIVFWLLSDTGTQSSMKKLPIYSVHPLTKFFICVILNKS